MKIKPEEISQVLRTEIEAFEKTVAVEETGTVLSVGDGIARVYGCEKVMFGELLEFPGGVFGLAMNLEEHSVGVVLLGGFVVQIGSEIWDASVAGKINKFRESLT